MEDDNGLMLSLGLSYGGSTSKSKGKENADFNLEEDATDKLADTKFGSMKDFLQNPVDDHEIDVQQITGSRTQQTENFWTDLKKYSDPEVNAHADGNADATETTGLKASWLINSKNLNLDNSAELGEDAPNLQDTGKKSWLGELGKRKMSFEEVEQHKKLQKEVECIDADDKQYSPLVINTTISIGTEDVSTMEKEEVAESQVEGSTSRNFLSLEKEKVQEVMSLGPHELHKQEKVVSNAPKIDGQSHALKQSLVANESKVELGNPEYVRPSSAPPLTITTSNLLPGNASSKASTALPSTTSLTSSNFQSALGYSSAQLPLLQTDASWGSVSRHQQVLLSKKNEGDVLASAENREDSSKMQAQILEPSFNTYFKNLSRQATTDKANASSSMNEDVAMRNSKQREVTEQPLSEIYKNCAIRPGVEADIKFGGSGSLPDLPWVSTTGKGPNGKPISGVSYRFSKDQIKIVCACHGSHMSPEEFIQHADGDVPPEGSGGPSPISNGNPTNPAKS